MSMSERLLYEAPEREFRWRQPLIGRPGHRLWRGRHRAGHPPPGRRNGAKRNRL